GSVSQNPNNPGSCTITFSAGPTTSGNPCQTFQTDAVPSFFDPDNPTPDFHLNPALDQALIDQGNPAAPPLGEALDLDGDPRVIDGACPIGAVRDIGADELNPGPLACGSSGPPPAAQPPPTDTQRSGSRTGLRAAALKRCRHKHRGARRACIRRAKRL